MIKPLRGIIGQKEVVHSLNKVIAAKNRADKKKKKFIFPPVKLGGLTGLGKSYLAETVAERLVEAGFQFITVPAKPGWNFYRDLAQKISSIDEDSGSGYAIPSVIFVDEAHEKNPIKEQIKLITGTEKPRLWERNGTKLFSDLSQHWWIFASDRELDPAQNRRLMEIILSPYEPKEKKELLKAMSDKKIAVDALEYFEKRMKPMAGHVQQVAREINLEEPDIITLAVAKSIIKHMGLFPQGLIKKDLEAMVRMAESDRPVPVEVLKATAGDVKVKATRARIGWLMALNLTEPKRGGYTLTTQGKNYLRKLQELQTRKPARAIK